MPVVGSSQQEGGLVSPAVTSRSIGLCFALESRIPGTLDSLMPFQSCPNGGKPKCKEMKKIVLYRYNTFFFISL